MEMKSSWKQCPYQLPVISNTLSRFQWGRKLLRSQSHKVNKAPLKSCSLLHVMGEPGSPSVNVETLRNPCPQHGPGESRGSEDCNLPRAPGSGHAENRILSVHIHFTPAPTPQVHMHNIQTHSRHTCTYKHEPQVHKHTYSNSQVHLHTCKHTVGSYAHTNIQHKFTCIHIQTHSRSTHTQTP